MSKRRTSSEWFELIESWEASGASAAAWCREHEIGYPSFLYWRRRRKSTLSPEGALALMPAKTGFCELVSSEGLMAEIDGVRLHLERGFDPVLLREAIAAIKGA